MNKLDQLRQMSDVVADTGDIQAIGKYKPVDATTNPSLILKAMESNQYPDLLDSTLNWARSLELPKQEHLNVTTDRLITAIGAEIVKIIPGRISTEVDARLSFNTKATLNRARRLVGFYDDMGISRDRVLIKMASTWEGIRAAEVLQTEGVDCNLTLLFSPVQAVAAAEAGSFLISPFVGRIYDWYCRERSVDHIEAQEDPGVESVRTIYALFKQRGYETVVMGASFRNTGQIEALSGCDRLTISPSLLAKLEQDEGKLDQQLPNSAAAPVGDDHDCPDESSFRLQLNADAMATEKLAEGIRLFIRDQIKLENIMAETLFN
jgi:transaldolase